MGAGVFRGKDAFLPDRHAIKESVERRISEYAVCPAFDVATILDSIDSLPDEIRPGDKPWVFRAEPEYMSGAFRLTGVDWSVEEPHAEEPTLAENDDLSSYHVLPRAYGIPISAQPAGEAWEHTILVVPHDKWLAGARSGSLPEITHCGRQGWQIAAVLLLGSECHCVLQRILPVGPNPGAGPGPR
jgi:hypothetical protein